MYVSVSVYGYPEPFTKELLDKCEFEDLDAVNPVMKLDTLLFVGHYEDVLGTDIFYLDDQITGVAATNKRLIFKRAFLSPSSEVNKHGDSNSQ